MCACVCEYVSRPLRHTERASSHIYVTLDCTLARHHWELRGKALAVPFRHRVLGVISLFMLFHIVLLRAFGRRNSFSCTLRMGLCSTSHRTQLKPMTSHSCVNLYLNMVCSWMQPDFESTLLVDSWYKTKEKELELWAFARVIQAWKHVYNRKRRVTVYHCMFIQLRFEHIHGKETHPQQRRIKSRK